MEVDVTDENFESEVIEKSKKVPVLVDFWAAWCGPCRILGPTLEKLAKEFKGKFILAKMSVDENQKTPQSYDVSSIPSVKLFKNGIVVDEFIGAMPEKAVKDWINERI